MRSSRRPILRARRVGASSGKWDQRSRTYDLMHMAHDHPTAIVSWAHTTEGWTHDQTAEWRQQVMALVDVLRDNGIDADIDLHHAGDVDWTRFGPLAIVDKDWVLVALSPSWKERFEGRNSPTVGAGAAGEANALRSIWADDQTAFQNKLVLLTLPMVRGERLIPVELHGVQHFTIEDFTNEALEPLLRLLTAQPAYPLRPLGPIPRLAPEARIPEGAPATNEAVDEASKAEPSDDQIRVLNAIHERTLANGDLPSFRLLDKQLDLEGLKLRELVQSMPPGLMRPDVAVSSYILREDDRLSVTLDGLAAYCRSGTDALDLLARALAHLAERERPFNPDHDGPPLIVTSSELRRDLGLTANQIRQIRVLIYVYSHQSWTVISGQDQEWSITVATEYIRRFRGVQDGGEFLRALAGDSFDYRREPAERQRIEDEENRARGGWQSSLTATEQSRAAMIRSLEKEALRGAALLRNLGFFRHSFGQAPPLLTEILRWNDRVEELLRSRPALLHRFRQDGDPPSSIDAGRNARAWFRQRVANLDEIVLHMRQTPD